MTDMSIYQANNSIKVKTIAKGVKYQYQYNVIMTSLFIASSFTRLHSTTPLTTHHSPSLRQYSTPTPPSLQHMTCLSPAACLLLWVCVCCCVLPLALAQEEVPVDVHVWWEDKKHNHENLIARLKKYSASLPQRPTSARDE